MRDGIKLINNYKLSYPYHLCPVCGMQSDTTNRVCSKHQSITYDQYGNVVSYNDYVILSPFVSFNVTPHLPAPPSKNL